MYSPLPGKFFPSPLSGTQAKDYLNSKTHLPEPFHALMTSDDSPIIDFYPEDFEIDMNGKKMAWQGVALLPFIEQDRLLSAIASKQDQLTDDEKRRNSHGVDVMLIMDENPLYQQFSQLYTKKRPSEVRSLCFTRPLFTVLTLW